MSLGRPGKNPELPLAQTGKISYNTAQLVFLKGLMPNESPSGRRSAFTAQEEYIMKGNQLLLIFACAVCVGLVFFSANAMLVVAAIGLLDFLMGLNIIRTTGANAQAKIMLATGAYIFVMGILYVTRLLPEAWFWDIFAGGLVIVVLVWFILLRKKRV